MLVKAGDLYFHGISKVNKNMKCLNFMRSKRSMADLAKNV